MGTLLTIFFFGKMVLVFVQGILSEAYSRCWRLGSAQLRIDHYLEANIYLRGISFDGYKPYSHPMPFFSTCVFIRASKARI